MGTATPINTITTKPSTPQTVNENESSSRCRNERRSCSLYATFTAVIRATMPLRALHMATRMPIATPMLRVSLRWLTRFCSWFCRICRVAAGSMPLNVCI